jgi:hypothetical protein
MHILRRNCSFSWDIIPCGLVKANWCFEGTCRLRLQIWRVREVIKQHEASWKQSFTYFFSYCHSPPSWNSLKDNFQFESWSRNSLGTVTSSCPSVLLHIWRSLIYLFVANYFWERSEPQGITRARNFRSLWYNRSWNRECFLNMLWREAGNKQCFLHAAPSKRRLTLTNLQGDITQKTELVMNTAVKS